MDLLSEKSIDLEKLRQGGYEFEVIRKGSVPAYEFTCFANNLLNPAGLLYKPIFDLQYLKQGGTKPKWPEEKKFAVCLTHDVDFVSFNSINQQLRTVGSIIREKESFLKKTKAIAGCNLRAFKAILGKTKKDPLFCYEKVIIEQKRVNANSTFFFWPGWKSISNYHPTDCLYDFDDKVVFNGVKCSVKEMIREIARNDCEIGLHASWHSFNDENEMKMQKEALENAAEQEIASVRQHFLHYDMQRTPVTHHKAGFKYDSSLGFNDNIGFRNGTSYPWRLRDFKKNSETEVVEVPLVIQDSALLSKIKGLKLDEETSFEYIKMIVDRVEEVGGIITMLWHPDKIVFDYWWNCYTRTLDYLHKKNPFIGSVRAIMDAFIQINGDSKLQEIKLSNNKLELE